MPASRWNTVYFCSALGCTAPVLEALHVARPEEIKLLDHALRQLPGWHIEDDDWFPDQCEPDTTITTATHFGTNRNPRWRRFWITWEAKMQRLCVEHYAARGPGPLRVWQIPGRNSRSPWIISQLFILQKYKGRGGKCVWYANGLATADPFERLAKFIVDLK